MAGEAGQERDWLEWHAPYDDPGSALTRRLDAVARAVARWLDSAHDGPLTVLSVCAGQGRDLVQAADGHPRAGDLRGLMVEGDGRNVDEANRRLARAGISGVVAVTGDASTTDAYSGHVPADLVLVCGVFGNISTDDVWHTIATLPALCAPGATVVWTRHRRPPDRTPAIRERFAACGFEELSFEAPERDVFGVGAHRLAGPPLPFVPGVRLFDFVGDGHLPA